MQYLYTFIALDLVESRAREARLARYADGFAIERPSVVRRALAHGLAAIARATASITRRLDETVADDLGRRLATSE